jgi:hypothetical protein
MRTRGCHLGVLVLACCSAINPQIASAQSTVAPTLSVDAAAARVPINPQIYGIASGLDTTFAKQIQVPNIRWGGDATSRYNWMIDSSNAGFDWYFMGGNGQTTAVPSASADTMVMNYAPANALITIPILPFLNKASAWSCSFPVAVYGAQQSTNPYVHPNGDDCGNSLTTSGKQLQDGNVYANHIDNTPAFQKQWVQHLVGAFGLASKGGVKFYQLDNEPFGWANTHRDVMPNGASYRTIVQLGQEYALAIKQADSSALVFGPSDFTLGGWIGNTAAQGGQSGLFAGQFYLQQMASYDMQHGQRILDYFDEHYYFNVSAPAAQLASTRTLWDPTYNGGTWVEQYDFNGPMQLIPRFKSWINTYYPGTKLSLSEYSIDSGQKSVVDAIAEMDVLGIFGREQLDFANMWSPPAPTDPIAYAFRMFRNYDGNGNQFADTSISAVSSDQGALSIYGGQRTADMAVTVLVINKTTSDIATTVAFTNLNLPATAQVYTYSAASLTAITHASDAPIGSTGIDYTFPSYSAVMFVVQPRVAAVPDYSLALSSSSLTSSASQAGSLMITVTPKNGLSGSLSFACQGLPSGWTCNFAPATVDTSATQSIKLTVSATTMTQNAAIASGMLAAAVCPLPLFLIGRGRGRRSWRFKFSALALLALAACGGGAGHSPATQASTSQITVTASGAGVAAHTQSFMLTVGN